MKKVLIYLNCYLNQGIVALTIGCWSAPNAFATSQAAGVFCEKNPKALGCDNPAASCGFCHAGPPSLNPYGADLKNLDLAMQKIYLYETCVFFGISA